MRGKVIAKFIVSNVVISALLYMLLTYYVHSRFFSYDLHKLLHILGAVLFLGNIIVTGVWMFLAERANNAGVIRFAARTLSRTDTYFTKPGVMLLIINGLMLSARWQGPFSAAWIFTSLALLMLSGAVWGGLLIPYQRKLGEFPVEPDGHQTQDAEMLFSVLHKWYWWGIFCIVLVLIALAMMTLKPNLW